MMSRFLIAAVLLVSSFAAHARLEPEKIDWQHPEDYVLDLSKMDKYVLARLVREAEINLRETVELPPNEDFDVIPKKSGRVNAVKRRVKMLAYDQQVSAPLEAMQRELLYRLEPVDDLRLFQLIRNAVAREHFEIPLHVIFEDSLSANTIATGDVFSTPAPIAGSNRDDVTVALDYLLSDIHSNVTRAKISKELLNIRDIRARANRFETSVSEKILATTTTFIAFTAIHSADGFRIALSNHIMSGTTRLRTRILLIFELQKQIKEELKNPYASIQPNLLSWLEQLVAGLRTVEGERIKAEMLDPEDRVSAEQGMINHLANQRPKLLAAFEEARRRRNASFDRGGPIESVDQFRARIRAKLATPAPADCNGRLTDVEPDQE